jgi:hypothetical protein
LIELKEKIDAELDSLIGETEKIRRGRPKKENQNGSTDAVAERAS